MTYLPAAACTNSAPAEMATPSNVTSEEPRSAAVLQDTTDKRGRLLVAEDDATIQRVMEQVLRKAGYEVRCAGNGQEAWEALSLESFDGLVTDHDMPLLTGLELLRRIRARHMPLAVVLISGRMPWSELDLQVLLKPGAALEKPFSVTQLLFTIRLALDDLSSENAIETKIDHTTGSDNPRLAD